jgi:1,4-dihydroxy-2-naphthoate octaprenyltransferase
MDQVKSLRRFRDVFPSDVATMSAARPHGHRPAYVSVCERVYARPVRPVLFRFRQLGALVRLGRPIFLTGGFILYGLGAAIAHYAARSVARSGTGAGATATGGAIDGVRYLWGQVAITATQLMTHYCNDYFDFAADSANTTPTRWSGGSRVLPAGELPRSVALVAALLLAALAATATIVLVARAGAVPLVALLLGAAIVLSWEYSAPPLRLHSTGWGELDVALVVSCLTPIIAFQLQAGRLSTSTLPLLAVAPLCCLQFAMLLSIEFPDAASDAATGKRTLVVRFGAPWSAQLYQAVLLLPYLLLPVLVRAGLPRVVALAALLPSPIAAWQIARMRRGDWRDPARWESLAFWSVALLIATSAAELGGFLLAART